MHAEILRVSQDIDARTGASSYALILSLPTGKVVRASVSEADAQATLAVIIGADLPAAPPAPEPAYEPPADEPPSWAAQQHPAAHSSSAEVMGFPEGAHIFGGQDEPDESAAPSPMPALPPPKPQRRARHVAKDEMGYPIVCDGSIDPGEIVSSEGAVDEEGIGQG